MEDVKHRNPRLVYCSLSGFGQTGPYRDRPALDPIIQAVTGVMSVTGEAEREPIMVGAPLADVIAGMFAAYTITCALRVVKRDGVGQYIDLSMQDAMLAAVGTRMGETLQAGISPGRLGNENPLRVPANTYETKDGRWLAVMVHGDAQWLPFCRSLHREEWIDYPDFRTMALRLQNRKKVNEVVAQRFAEHPAQYWMPLLEGERIPYALVRLRAGARRSQVKKHQGYPRIGSSGFRAHQYRGSAVDHVGHARRDVAAAHARAAHRGSAHRMARVSAARVGAAYQPHSKPTTRRGQPARFRQSDC